MSFVSFGYFGFLALLLIIYYIMPHRFRWSVLLAASAAFCAMLSVPAFIWVSTAALISYVSAIAIRLLARTGHPGWAKAAFVFSLVLCFGTLALFKFAPVICARLSGFSWYSAEAAQPLTSLVLPLGMSFYLFQVTGYLIDVYREKINPTTHFGKYLLAVSFFPKLVQGPIEPVDGFIRHLSEKVSPDPLKMREGAVRILIGLCQKAVVADRLCVTADKVFGSAPHSNGLTLVIGAVCYSFQLYTDFAGYTNMALGSAQLFGISLTENFRQPYLSQSIAEFWRRWHISLSSWLRDYLYFPLGGSRVSRLRWAFNIMTVFFVSGLWHGAGLSFIVWGLMHGAMQVVGKLTMPAREKLRAKLPKPAERVCGWLRVVFTFVLVTAAWVFFRAEYTMGAVNMLLGAVTREWRFVPEQLGAETNELILSLILTVLTVVWDIVCEREEGHRLIERQKLPVRWAVYLVMLILLVLFGCYGSLSADSFIYVSF